MENTSSQTIDYINLTFEDTLAEESERLLNESSLDELQSYELESDLRERPVFEWEQRNQTIRIEPDERQVLSVLYRGKLGW